MKKSICITLFLLAMALNSNSQELGVRFGSFTGSGGVALDGIFHTGEFNRIHWDVSFGRSIGADVLWDFIYRPVNGEALFWYLGAGAFSNLPFDDSQKLGLGAIGEIGLSYTFNEIPVSISGDWRPYFRLIADTDISLGGFGLNVRYVFGEN